MNTTLERERPDVSGLTSDLQLAIRELCKAPLTPDHHRVIASWLRRFMTGARDHPPLVLRGFPSLPNAREEISDMTSYLEMALEQLREIQEILQK